MATRSSSGLAYPERFYTAAAYAGFGTSDVSSSKAAISRFKNEIALLLYGLYQQATVGPCNISKPRSWNPIEHSKWTSWNGLGNMASTEAMRLFVKILEEEDPAWYSRVPEPKPEPVVEVENPSQELVSQLDNSVSVSKETATENGSMLETHDKDVVMEALGSIGVYDQWVAPSVSGRRPKARYEHAAAVVQEKMYVFGGNHNGRYLNDIQVLDLKSLTWSKMEAKMASDSSQAMLSPCAGHSLIRWGNKLLAVAGHTKDPSDTVGVLCIDTETCTWSVLKTYGKSPIARGGQSLTLVGSNIVMFGGEDSRRTLLNDLNILDLETMTWDAIEPVGTPPSPRSDHTAAVHADKYLLIFGGGSHSTCFNDLHVLDLQTMEWSQPKMQGTLPAPRAGHAGVTIGENWYIVGGGDNKSGVSDTMVLNMSMLVWSVVTTVQGRVPLASEGLSLELTTSNGEDILVAFGGYNGRYSNELYVLKPSHKGILEPKILESPATASGDPVLPISNGVRDMEAEDLAPDGKVREIVMDNPESEPLLQHQRSIDTKERIIVTLKAEKENLEATLTTEHSLNSRLKQELSEAQAANAELTEELRSVRKQLASEQTRCFRLEVEVAELRQKLQSMESLQQEVELLQRQKAASEQAVAHAQQKQSSIWGWIAGNPPDPKSIDA